MTTYNPIVDPKARMINGPVNVIRMEGEVFGIKKIIYLFMDYHMSVTNQTQCENVFSKDIQYFLADNFYKLSNSSTDRIYDFFAEIYPTELANTRYQEGIQRKDYREKYIEEVVKFFRKIFRYDKQKNKVVINKLFRNVRLHYLDVRDYYKHNIHHQVSEITQLAKRFMINDNIDLRSLNRIIELAKLMGDHFAYIIKILKKTHDKNDKKEKRPIIIRKRPGSVDRQVLDYLTHKIKSVYKHDKVKDIMNMLIDNTIKNFELAIKEIDQAVKRFQKYWDQIKTDDGTLIKDTNTYSYGLSSYTIRNMIIDINNTVEKLLEERFIEFFARLTDIYFLRRFLDKDYITHAIVYSGALHSNTYVYVLSHFFDFKITHASYSKITNMLKLNNEVKNRSLMELQELILPQNFQQCSNLTTFPRDFL